MLLYRQRLESVRAVKTTLRKRIKRVKTNRTKGVADGRSIKAGNTEGATAYDVAGNFALADKQEGAFHYLELAIGRGYYKREFVSKGIQPTKLVSPTVSDSRAGRDTVLEAALTKLKPLMLKQ